VKGGLEIRRATEPELAEVVQLERDSPTAPHWGLAEYERMLWVGDPEGVRRALFVAADGQVVSGFAVGRIHGAEAEIESVVVRESARRQGLGSALCRAIMAWAREEGADAVELEVRIGSAGARRLYGGLGFVAVGRRPAYYREPVEDGILMRCELRGALDEGPGLFEST
jgi:ribosomal-protein-alanine N-acetyltransferase